jgi:hypothetical protein
MSEKKSFFLALKIFANDLWMAFSNFLSSLGWFSRDSRWETMTLTLRMIEEKLERIEERLGGKLEKNGGVHPKNADSGDQLFSTFSTYPDNPRSDKEILDDMAPKSEVGQDIKEKMDEIKKANSENNNVIFLKTKQAQEPSNEWIYKASDLFPNFDPVTRSYLDEINSEYGLSPVFYPEPEAIGWEQKWDLEEIRKKERGRMEKRVTYLKGEDRLNRIEEIESIIKTKGSFVERKQNELERHKNNLKECEEYLIKLEENKKASMTDVAEYRCENRSSHKNIRRQILDLENQIDITKSEIISIEVKIEVTNEGLLTLREELSLLKNGKEEKEADLISGGHD